MGFGVERDEATGGKHVPFWGAIPGWTFRLSCHWESMSHPTARFRVAVSA